jgi:hypothetical protein
MKKIFSPPRRWERQRVFYYTEKFLTIKKILISYFPVDILFSVRGKTEASLIARRREKAILTKS